MIVSSKRPKNVAIFSFIMSVLFFGTALLLGKWSGFFAISAAGWFILYVALIWFVLCIQFYQRALAEQEKLDLSQLSAGEQGATIFHEKSEHENLFSVAQGRLKILEKWFVPIFAGVIASYQIIVGILVFRAAFSAPDEEPIKPLFCSIIMAAIAFMSFLLSRYATGMSSQREWKPLRAGGSSMLGASLLSFVLAIALAVVHLFPSLNSIPAIIAKVIPAFMIVFGLETALNLIMDIYRPRLKGQYSRSAFDSRLLGVINEPGGILRSAADALDYQFGFKVSQTWFYKLLEQAIVPLVLFGAVTLYAMSCIVVVGPDEQGIIEHFGNPLNKANEARIINPGLTLKLPWPIDKTYIYPVSKISEISIGYLEDEAAKAQRSAKLWGQKHYKEEYKLLVASEQKEQDSSDTTVPVNLVNASVPVQYRIKDVYSYIYDHNDPDKVLESICYRELTKYAVSAKLEEDKGNEEKNMRFLFSTGLEYASDLNNGTISQGLRQKFDDSSYPLSDNSNILVEDEGNSWKIITDMSREYRVRKENDSLNFYKMEYSLLGKGRIEASKVLTKRIQDAADREGLGIEIVFLGLQGVHPPVEVAADYEKVTGAIQQKQRLILDAQANSIKTLSACAGSVAKAHELDDLDKKVKQAEQLKDPNLADYKAQLDTAFGQANGITYKTLSEAQTYAYGTEIDAEATGKRFAGQLQAYRAAPDIYLYEQWIKALENTYKDVRKYVIMGDGNEKQVNIINLENKVQNYLTDIGDAIKKSREQ